MRAKPWQRYVMCMAVIGGGVALVALGHVAGALLSLMGAGVLVQMIGYRLRRARPERSAPSDNEE